MDTSEHKGFCMLPWTHLQVRPDGRVYSCCMADAGNPLGDLRRQSLSEIWNAPAMKSLRREMLDGKSPAQCNYCHDHERDTGGSFRTYANGQFKHHRAPMLSATKADGHADKVNIVYMDFRLSNVCNFRCRSCGTYASSSWNKDQKKLRPLRQKVLDAIYGCEEREAVQLAYNGPDHLEEILDVVVPNLEEIYFAGGEPMVMEEHYRILDRLIGFNRFDVRIRYSTNFSKLEFRGRDVCEIWDRFDDVTVQASLDDSYARGEYLRKGQNWKRTVANRVRMFSACPRAKFEISATVSAYNVWHIPDFFREWVELGYVTQEKFLLNPLYGPPNMRVQVLPPAFKAKVLAKYERLLSDFVIHPRARQRFEGIMEILRSPDESHNLRQFVRWTRRLDAVRSESFERVFPELAELV